jgi:hypothetical protein
MSERNNLRRAARTYLNTDDRYKSNHARAVLRRVYYQEHEEHLWGARSIREYAKEVLAT